MSIETIETGIQLPTNKPLRMGRIGPVQHLIPRFEPVKAFRLLGPKRIRIGSRPLCQPISLGWPMLAWATNSAFGGNDRVSLSTLKIFASGEDITISP